MELLSGESTTWVRVKDHVRGGREKIERRHSIYAMLGGGDNGCGKAVRGALQSAHLGPVCMFCVRERAVQRG
jgi:hypothetical protein